MNTDDYEGHTPIWYLYGEVGAWWVQSDFTTHDDFIIAEVRSQNEVDAKLITAAPDLLADNKRLRALLINTFWDGVSGIKEQDERTHDGLVKEYMELIG